MKQIFLITVCVMVLCCGCAGVRENYLTGSAENEEYSREIFAMDTYMSIKAYGKNGEEAVKLAEKEIERLETILSTGDDDSEVGELNHVGSAVLSEDTANLMKRALEINHDTDGVFNIAIYPIMEAWGFPQKEFRVPTQDELDQLLPLTDVSAINFNANSNEVNFETEEMKIDFGGIAKGYTSSKLIEIFKECGVTSGIVSLGGNVQVLGTKTDGSLWRVAVKSPDASSDYLGILEIRDKAVITSGGYERYFEQDGQKYHHIIDPATGRPADNGLLSVTVISEDGTLADALSTALYIMGREKAVEYWEAHREMFDVILYTDNQELYVTEGVADCFTSDYAYDIIVN